MGIKQSREDQEPTLRLLRSFTPQMFKSAHDKMVSLSRQKCKMFVSKWELLLILQLKAGDVKQIAQFLTGEDDPESIDINQLYTLLTLTSQHMKPEDKTMQIIRFISFETRFDSITEGNDTMTFDEAKYMFQICYQLLHCITDLDLINNPVIQGDQDGTSEYGSNAEHQIVTQAFQAEQGFKDAVEQKVFHQQFVDVSDIERIIAIFEVGKFESEKPQEEALQTLEQRQQSRLDLGSSVDVSQDGYEGALVKDNMKIEKEFTASPDINKPLQAQKSFKQPDSQLLAGQIASSQTNRIQFQISQQNESGEQGSEQVSKNKVNTRLKPEVQMTEAHSPHSLNKMSKKLVELKNNNQEDVWVHNQCDLIQQVGKNIDFVLNKQQELYVQKQFVNQMQTFVANKKEADMGQGYNQKVVAQAVNQVQQYEASVEPDTKDKHFTVQQKQALVNSLIQRNVRNDVEALLLSKKSFLSYQIKTLGPQLMYFYAQPQAKNQKLLLEQRKFKYLGQFQTLKAIYSRFVESNFDMDIVTGDKLFSFIYMFVQEMYKSKTNQKFLVDLIDIKTKKRESKRTIYFLEGACQVLKELSESGSTKVKCSELLLSTQYQEAYMAFSSKLHNQKTVEHMKLVKLYSVQKINLINYFCALGKLRAMFKIHKHKDKSLHTIKEMFVDELRKIRLKMEHVDVQLVQQLQAEHIKKGIKQQYYQSLGQMAAVKCSIKGVDYCHIYDYLILQLLKHRTEQSVWVNHQIKEEKEERRIVSNSSMQKNLKPATQVRGSSRKLTQKSSTEHKYGYVKPIGKLNKNQLAALMTFQKMKYLENKQDIGTEEEGATESYGMNLKEYHHELEQLINRSKKSQMKLQNFNATDKTDKQKQQMHQSTDFIQNTSISILSKMYASCGCSDHFQSVAKAFETSPLKKQTFGIDHSHVQKKKEQKEFNDLIRDFDKFENFVYEFIPFAQVHEVQGGKQPAHDQEEDDHQLDKLVATQSNSFQCVLKDEYRKQYYKEKREAHTLLQAYLERIRKFDGDDWDEQFTKTRDGVFEPAAEVLFSINKKGYLNGFNLKYLTLPIEHSIHYNYWCYAVVKLHIKEKLRLRLLQDTTQIIISSDINVFQLFGASTSMPEHSKEESAPELINITQASGAGDQTPPMISSVNPKSIRKCRSVYQDLFSLLSHQEHFELKTKQSLFKNILMYLDYSILVTESQQSMLWDMISKLEQSTMNMSKFQDHLQKEINALTDEQTVTQHYDDFEDAFKNKTKAGIMGQHIDSVLSGCRKYLSLLRESLMKDVNQSESMDIDETKSKLDYISKLGDDIKSLQSGLGNRYNKIIDQLKKELESKLSSSAAASKPRGSKSPPKRERALGSNLEGSAALRKGKPQSKDIFDTSYEAQETKLVMKLITMKLLMELMCRQRANENDPVALLQEMKTTLETVNNRNSRLNLLHNYLFHVCGYCAFCGFNDEGAKQNQANLNFGRGANILNRVMSGNIVDKCDVYSENVLAKEVPQGSPDAGSKRVVSVESFKEDQLSLNVGQQQSSLESKSVSKESGHLTSNQKSLNYLCNFLKQLSLVEDRIFGGTILKKSQVFFVANVLQVDHLLTQSKLELLLSMKHCLNDIMNVYVIHQTSVEAYLNMYATQSRYLKTMLFESKLHDQNEIIINKFYHVMSLNGPELMGQAVNKIGEVFSETNLQDDEKTDFANAQAMVRRSLDISMKEFKEWLDIKANKNLVVKFQNSLKQQDIKISQTLTSMQSLVHVYFMKLIQEQEDFLWWLQKQRDHTKTES